MAIGSNGGAGERQGVFSPAISAMIGVLIIVVIIVLGPSILAQVYQAQPTQGLSPSNPWNVSNTSSGLQNGVSVWNNSTLMVGVVIIVFFVYLVLRYLQII